MLVRTCRSLLGYADEVTCRMYSDTNVDSSQRCYQQSVFFFHRFRRLSTSSFHLSLELPKVSVCCCWLYKFFLRHIVLTPLDSISLYLFSLIPLPPYRRKFVFLLLFFYLNIFTRFHLPLLSRSLHVKSVFDVHRRSRTREMRLSSEEDPSASPHSPSEREEGYTHSRAQTHSPNFPPLSGISSSLELSPPLLSLVISHRANDVFFLSLSLSLT